MPFNLADGTYLAEGTGGLLAGLGGLYGAWRAHQKTVQERVEIKQQNQRVWDRLLGQPADPEHGLPAVPGIFDKVEALSQVVYEVKDDVSTLHDTVADVQSTVKTIEADMSNVKTLTTQLKPNGGKSLADKVTRTESKVDSVSSKLDEHLEHSKQVEADLNERIVRGK